MNAIGQTLSFPFVDLPLTDVDVDVTVFLKGDIQEEKHWYYLEGENFLVAYPGRFVNKTRCGSFEQEDHEITQ
jgi:hypothetical protein